MPRLAAPLAAILTCAVAAQAPVAPPQPDRQVFRSGVDVTAVDVAVVDRDGTPVGDLNASDFTVAVDGRPRRILFSQFISLASTAPPGAAAPHRDYTTNTQKSPGRLIVLAIDQGNIR